MAKRFRIGINFFFDNSSNSGIVNYVFNIISALKTLNEEKVPEIIVFYSINAPIDFLKQINYPFITFIKFEPHPKNYFLMKANSLLRKILKKDFYKDHKYFKLIDCLYPYFEFMDYDFVTVKNKIHWLVDFNNRAFPQHYPDNGNSMNVFQAKLAKSNDKIVLSSYSLLNELKFYHPNYTCKVKILRFASTLPIITDDLIKLAKLKYKIDQPYLMSPNQFWEHKNQIVVLEALNIIKISYPEIKLKILFTGSLEVSRGKGFYIEELKKKVNQFELNDYIQFLGVIDRNDQLALMKGSSALIQPSLYEGWSTLVEEAKALNKFIILSDLPVHREQITSNVAFFDPHNAQILAELIVNELINPSIINELNYNENIRKFGIDIFDAFLA